MNNNMDAVRPCRNCGAPCVKGEVLSGSLSYGAIFNPLEPLDASSSDAIGNGKIFSFACTKCGLVTSYLASAFK